MQKYHLKLAGAFFILISLAFITYIASSRRNVSLVPVNDFDSCVQSGGMVLERYPAECRMPDGTSFTEEVDGDQIFNPDPETVISCVKLGGQIDLALNECEGISKKSCDEIGGTFEECASPCRADPDAEVCILMCEQTCLLN